MAANSNCAWHDYTCMRTYNVSSPSPRTLRCRHYAWRLPIQQDIDACMQVKLPYSAAPDALGDFEGDTTWWTKKAQSGLGLGLGTR